MNLKKRLASAFLTLCMLVTLLPGAALAVEDSTNPIAQPVELDVDLKQPNGGEQQPKLLEVADSLSDGDMVQVIVLFNDKSLLEKGFTTEQIAANTAQVSSAVKAMEDKQTSVAKQIQTLSVKALKDAEPTDGPSVYGLEQPKSDADAMTVRYNYTVAVNGMAVEVPYGALDDIRALKQVKEAFLSPIYSLPEKVEATHTNEQHTVATQNEFGTIAAWNEAGYTGKGMRIAVIDTGLDTDHPSFKDAPVTTASSLTKEEISDVLTSLNAYSRFDTTSITKLTADKLYVSAKIPFAFNYVDKDTDVTHDHDGQGDHGTHVAGIAAANKISSTKVVGVAPDAQVIVMKVFGKNGGAFTSDILAALEDCFRLGVDVVNMSLGSSAGFTYEGMTVESIYSQIASHDILVAIAAGNSGSAAANNPNGTNLNFTRDPDNGLASSPGTYTGATMVASSENTAVFASCITVGGREIPYSDVADKPFTALAGTHEYVCAGLGTVENFAQVDVKGKIALVQRGTIAFVDKQKNAFDAGAVGVIVFNNTPGDFTTLSMQDAGILPNVFVSLEDGAYMVEQAGDSGVGTLTVNSEQRPFESENGGLASDFSSWGVSPDLQLQPDVSAPGGNIYSSITDGKYGTMSGTSMACPHIAGLSALVMQHLHESYPNLSDSEIHVIAEALVMSTATPYVNEYGTLYSPRKQGAGEANAYAAVSSPVYVTVNQKNGEKTPKASLGDDPSRTGVYTFDFTLHNLTNKPAIYELDGLALSEYVKESAGMKFMAEIPVELDAEVSFDVPKSEEPPIDVVIDGVLDIKDVQYLLDCVNGLHDDAVTDAFVAEYDLNKDGKLDTADVQLLYEMLNAISTEDGSTVLVPASSDVTVKATITLTADDKAYLGKANFPNGIYVDGFVRCYAQSDGAQNLSVPFLAFYGSWKDAPVFDYGWYYDDANTQRYPNTIFVNFGSSINGLGFNPYLSEKNDPYDPSHNVLSVNGDGYYDYVYEIYLGMLRGAEMLDFEWFGADGKPLFYEWYPYARKSYYNAQYRVALPFMYYIGEGEACAQYFFEDENGNPTVENNDKVKLVIRAYLDDGDLDAMEIGKAPNPNRDWADQVLEIPVVIDNEKPTMDLDDDAITFETKNERTMMTFTVSDNYDIAAVIPLTMAKSPIEYVAVNTKTEGDSGETAELTLDVTDYGATFYIAVGDYGGNESYYLINNPAGGKANNNQFYGYRLRAVLRQNGQILRTAGYNGWTSFEDPMDMTNLTSANDETVVHAAEYVDGYVIGVDKDGAVFATKPGDWNRTILQKQLKVTVEVDYGYGYTIKRQYPTHALDMALDYTTGTLYVLADEYELGAGCHLLTMDPTNGKVTDLGIVGSTGKDSTEPKPLTLACDNDGVLYTVDMMKGGLYTIDKETLEMKLKTKMDIVPAPNTQSMTVDHDTNRLYWSVYLGNTGDLYDANYFVEVDTETGELKEYNGNGGHKQYNDWLTSLFKPTNRDIKKNGQTYHPFNEPKLKGLNITNGDVLYMIVGQTETITCIPDPFYADLGKLSYSIENTAVATVNKNGIVTAKTPGSTTLTVTDTENNFKKTCTINVSAVTGEMLVFDAAYGSKTSGWLYFDAGKPGQAAVVYDAALKDAKIKAAAFVDNSVYAIGCEEDPETADTVITLYQLDSALQLKNSIVIGTYKYDDGGGDWGGWDDYGLDDGFTPDFGEGDGGDTGENLSFSTVLAMAFSYPDNAMYMVAPNGMDPYTWEPMLSLFKLNLVSGEFVEVASLSDLGISGESIGGMAIDYDGNFYFAADMLDFDTWENAATLVKATLEDGTLVEVSSINASEYFGEWTGIGSGSMVYSDQNKGLLLAAGDDNLYFVDMENSEQPVLSLGAIADKVASSSNYGLMAMLKTEPAKGKVQPDDFEIQETYRVAEGGTVAVTVTAVPWNATCQNVKFEITEGKDVASVDENGVITGLKVGTATLSVTVGGITEPKTAKIEVEETMGKVYGFIINNLVPGLGGAVPLDKWAGFPIQNTMTGEALQANSAPYTAYAGAYYDGYIYAYGQNNVDYSYRLMKVDPSSFTAEYLGDAAALTVRDMAFDYTTGAMYAVAQEGNIKGGVYQVDLETGEFVLVGDCGKTLVAVAVDDAGQMYVLATDGGFYKIDKTNPEKIESVGNVGTVGETYHSMHYDYGTDTIYWANNKAMVYGHLYSITKDGKAELLGQLDLGDEAQGQSYGCATTSLFTVRDNLPTLDSSKTVPATGVVLGGNVAVTVGESLSLKATVLPISVCTVDGANLSWKSSNPEIATVANGVVKGVAPGQATITVTTEGDETDTCTVYVTEQPRAFRAYNEDTKAWISFDASGKITVDKQEDADVSPITATALVNVDGKDVLYAYDKDGYFYKVDPDTLERGEQLKGISDMDTSCTEKDGTEIPLQYWVVDLAASEDGKLYGVLMADYFSFQTANQWFSCEIAELDPETGEVVKTIQTCIPGPGGDIRPANLMYDSGVLYFIDGFNTGTVTRIDLSTGAMVEMAVCGQYWGDYCGSRGMVRDEITGTIYALRDLATDYYTTAKPKTELVTVGLNTAAINVVAELGVHLISGLYIR